MTRPLKLDKRGRLEIPEADLQRASRELLMAHHWLIFPQSVTIVCRKCGAGVHVPGAQAGQPDDLALKPGPRASEFCATWWRAVYIEYKRRGKKARPDQALYHAALRREGFEVLVISSVEQLAEWMGVKLGSR